MAFNKSYTYNGFLFKESGMCVLNRSLRELLVPEAHSGGLIEQFGVLKSCKILHKHFYLLAKMKRDIGKIYERCLDCKQVKSKSLHIDCTYLFPSLPYHRLMF